MNLVITGGAGFIGSNLCEELLNEGHNVICIDNFNEFYDPTIKRRNIETFTSDNFRLYEGDILDKSFLSKVFSDNTIDIVIHLAAMAGVRSSIENPFLYYNVNVIGTLNVLEVMKESKVKNLIFASSSSIYGNNKKIPFSELDNVDNPISPYAASKKAGELLCHTYFHLHKFNISCLRFFTVYGPKQRPDLAIYKFTKALLNDEPIVLFGNGSMQRDYTHIEDIIHGIKNALIRLDGFNIYNLGESKTISLIELIDLLEKYTEKVAKITYLPMQPGDVNQTFADISKAQEKLSYSPNISIECGLKDFVNWYKTTIVLYENIAFNQ
jgi:UDP-glucuronate 4-epimerase